MAAIKTVLIIDDEEDIRAVGCLSLERVGGCRVLAAGSGAEGLELAAAEEPDAILLDAMMPEMDGPETIRRLRESPRTASIPVVFLTAKLQPADRERYLELGAEAVLAKPFDPMTLPGELGSALGWEP